MENNKTNIPEPTAQIKAQNTTNTFEAFPVGILSGPSGLCQGAERERPVRQGLKCLINSFILLGVRCLVAFAAETYYISTSTHNEADSAKESTCFLCFGLKLHQRNHPFITSLSRQV